MNNCNFISLKKSDEPCCKRIYQTVEGLRCLRFLVIIHSTDQEINTSRWSNVKEKNTKEKLRMCKVI